MTSVTQSGSEGDNTRTIAYDDLDYPTSFSDSRGLGGFNRFWFTGHEFDPETELTYAKARFYDQDLGLFASTDPVLGDFDKSPSLHCYRDEAVLKLEFLDVRGNVLSNDFIRLKVAQYLQGPGVVNGRQYIKDYTYSLPEEPSGNFPDARGEVERFIGFTLGHPAKMTFEFHGKKLVDGQDLKPGTYKYSTEIDPLADAKRQMAEDYAADHPDTPVGLVQI